MGKSYLVIPKIREIAKALGNVVITFDNGDKKTLAVDEPDAVIKLMLNVINHYYQGVSL